MLYFSYGSNMSSKRVKDRVPSANFVTVATLYKHDLRFHKKGKDDSGKCDVYETNNNEHSVIGVVFEISELEKPGLDRIEELGYGYEEKIVRLTAYAGEIIEATTYYATSIDSRLKPYHWYKHHVLTGAKENRLPEVYKVKISNIASIPDSNSERDKKEMTIYACE